MTPTMWAASSTPFVISVSWKRQGGRAARACAYPAASCLWNYSRKPGGPEGV